ncbi:hypothetical protein PCANC_19242 [Puccinia coronata f. sp. avenae]|uniref:Uncharacterized protein n=1 Tax=Puccinia coronata f. sp. avenae TaxID=200324 RepID=A0A2N5TN63_9BASI|nr:hypothetical protein PCANC_24560 [Puccinia coronata f. sp. avenae]PLW27005.1 hypothetical protein PCANC_21529 [Puccinia coronata f. sp. avenae]PLW34523.1 hypothetical protein PCANC_19242 [Puccinia coronata f. sp. avenae]
MHSSSRIQVRIQSGIESRNLLTVDLGNAQKGREDCSAKRQLGNEGAKSSTRTTAGSRHWSGPATYPKMVQQQQAVCLGPINGGAAVK